MRAENPMETREKIIGILRRRGPSLPVHIAKETGLSILFASAFLSELLSDKSIEMSSMRVGSSPIYFLRDHSYMLERFSQHLKSREKDAFLLIREKKFLRDSEQTPVIRVALRSIKDFALPFRRNGVIFWRYYLVPESEFHEEVISEEKRSEKEQKILEEPKKEVEVIVELTTPMEKDKEEKEPAKESKEKTVEIFDKKPSQKIQKTKAKKTKKKLAKTDDKFFNRVKEWLSGKSMEIIDIQNFNKNDLQLRIKNKEGKEELLMAYNRKKVSDSDIIKANKKSQELGLPYNILSLGEPSKKISDLINAAKNLTGIQKMS